MIPVYLVIGLINVLAKTNNYGINITDADMDIRVRRDLTNTDTSSSMLNHLFKSHNENLVRDKRQFSFLWPKKSQTTTTPKYGYNNLNAIPKSDYSSKNYYSGKLATQNKGKLNKNLRLASKPVTNQPVYNNWNTVNISNAAKPVNNSSFGIYVRNNVTGYYEYRPVNLTVSNFTFNGLPNSWQYPSKTTFMPKFNTTEYWQYNGTGYNPQAPNTPPNYQDPNKENFQGYYQQTFSKTGNNTTVFNSTNNTTTIKPYAPGSLPIPTFNGVKPSNNTTPWYKNFNNTAAPYNSTQPTPISNTTAIAIACVICKVGCPSNHHWAGFSCVPDEPVGTDYD